MPAFYSKVFPMMQKEYSILNGLVKGLGGFLSVMLCGIISDRFELRNRMIKSQLSIAGALLAIPLMAGCCLFEGTNFYLSLGLFGLKFLISEGWMAPTVTMMQSTVKPEFQGGIVSAYLFFLTASGCASTLIMSKCANIFQANAFPHVYGKLIFFGSLIGYLGSIPCYWKAGKYYI